MLAEWIVSICIGVVVAALVYWSMNVFSTSKKLPPGPVMPVMRNLFLEFSSDPSKLIDFKKYGPVCSFRFMHVVTIILNTQDAIKSMLVEFGDLTSHRWQTNYVHPKLDFHGGVISSEGPLWREHRSFILSTLRKFGLTRYEQPIQNELSKLIEFINKNHVASSTPLDPGILFSRATSNVINKMVYGKVLELEDKQLIDLVHYTMEFLSDVEFHGSLLLELLGPAAFYVPGDWLHANRQRKNIDAILSFIDDQIEECSRKRETQDESESSSLLESYLRQRNDRESLDADQKDFSIKQIRTTLFDLMLAGMDTTSTTLRWSVLLLAQFEEVQRRAQREIDELLEGRMPNLADRSRLIYCEAVLHEVERFATIVPLALPHKASESFTFRGFLVPKSCMLLPNIYAVHHDVEQWPDALHFNPANFYDESTHSLRNLDKLVPFSVGRRSCLGETLAKQELFIFLVGLLQAFEFSAVAGDQLPDCTHSINTLVRGPLRYRVSVKARHNQKINE